MALGHRVGTARQFISGVHRRSPRNDGEYAMNVSPWSDREKRRLYEMRGRGESVAYIAMMLCKKESQVRHRLRWDAMKPEEKARRSEACMIRQRAARAGKQLRPRQNVIQEIAIYRPTPEMLADRARREAMPYRDLTAALCGDPPLGLSALDGRR